STTRWPRRCTTRSTRRRRTSRPTTRSRRRRTSTPATRPPGRGRVRRRSSTSARSTRSRSGHLTACSGTRSTASAPRRRHPGPTRPRRQRTVTARGALVLAAAVATAAALPAGAQPAAHFAYGVASAEVSARSALLWTRADASGNVTLQVGHRTFTLTAGDADDLTVQRTVAGLKPGTAYTYVFSQNGHRSAVGHFRTAPAPARNVPIRFAFSGDADAQPAMPGGAPFYNRFQVYDR